MLTLVMPAPLIASMTVAKAPKGTSSSARMNTDWFCGSRIFCRSLDLISLILTGSFPRNTRCCLLMLITMRSSVISFTVRVLGTFTSIPDCRTGAVTMKMISSTRTTSTSGVMLISASEVRVWPLLAVKATRGPPLHRFLFGSDLFQAVEQFAREVVHAGAELAQRRGELVVGDHGGDGHQQAGSGRDQRFRDSGGDRAQRGCAFCSQPVKRVDNAHDGAEEAHKGGDCA